MFENIKRWEDSVPTDLIPVVEHLRESFDGAHWGCGQTTQVFCYSVFHNKSVDDPRNEYTNYFMHMKATVGQAATDRFHELVKERTFPAVFKAFFDLYLEGMSIQALKIFNELVEIGRANENRIPSPYMDWAEAQTKHLIRSHAYRIPTWVRDVCDKQVFYPNDDIEEQVFWRKWQAPLFLIMKPSLHTPYDIATVWHRKDTESSSRLLQHFTEHYVVHLEMKIRKAAGDSALELAKKPIPTQKDASDGDSPRQDLSKTTIREQRDRAASPARSVKREARKQDTRAMRESWRREYRKIKKKRPDMSDVWYSRQIERLDIARGRSAETIRRHMTK